MVGGPGSGKTVALGELSRRHQVLATHFCRARDDRLVNPVRLVEYLSAAIAAASPAFAATLLRDPMAPRSVEVGDVTVRTGAVAGGAVVTGLALTVGPLSARAAFDRLVRRPWDDTADADLPAARLVVVDALDESLSWPAAETVASLLAAVVGAPPRGMRFVVSARPLPDLLTAFPSVPRLDLDAHPEESDADVRRLVARHGVRDVEGVVRAAAGNLLVAAYLMRSPGLAGSSAPGLQQVYRDFVDRDLRRDLRRWRDVLSPVLATLGVLRGPGATAPEIAVLAGLPVRATRDALADSAAFTRRDAVGRWRVYHESFRDYLAADDEIGAGPEQDLVVAEHLLDRFGSDWWRCEMSYAVEHVAGTC